MTDKNPGFLFFQSGYGGIKPVFNFQQGENDQKVLIAKGVPVFRSGTFADSMGEVTTWTPLQMQQAKANFDSLVASGVVPKVPVRRGHNALFGNRMDTLIGWHTGLDVTQHTNPIDNTPQTYLLADFTIFDETAQLRVMNGDWPNRSAEIGSYSTNDNAEIYPAYMGFAFVDLPAVEGLNYGSQEIERKFTVLIDKPVSTKEHSVTAPAATATPPEAAATAPAAVAPVPAPPAPPAVVEPPAAAATATAAFAAPTSVNIFGKPVSDFAAVQAHITNLETFQSETLSTARKDFVTGLAKDNKIGAPQIESLQAFALGLSEDQYVAWTKTYETAVALPILANHAAGANNTGASNGNTVETETELQNVRDIVRQHTLAGMAKDKLEKLPSYQRMIVLEAAAK